MSRSLELPDSINQALLNAAGAGGVTPVDWIAQRLPRLNGSASSKTERKAGLARLIQHTVSLGKPTGANKMSKSTPTLLGSTPIPTMAHHRAPPRNPDVPRHLGFTLLASRC
jgi:hypothetical protein